MLVPYRKDYQKIVMGLLSFSADLPNYDYLQAEIDWSNLTHYPIYLWKAPYSEQFIGVAVLEVGDEYVLVRRLSFPPSERSGKNVYDFLTAIEQKYPNKRIMGTLDIQPLITNWARSSRYRVTKEQVNGE
ncbi:MAG TPA: reductase [Candidatus Limosilactobacillus faecipullorum]|nr:reductase [Candidatus Limosilactobacillus faecipullorum]